jgi:hypothetical protein
MFIKVHLVLGSTTIQYKEVGLLHIYRTGRSRETAELERKQQRRPGAEDSTTEKIDETDTDTATTTTTVVKVHQPSPWPPPSIT